MELPLSELEIVLGIEGLQVTSEDEVYDFILEWARVHYPELEERREILTKRLLQFICFPNMSSSKLKEVLVCPEFEHENLSNLVLNAFISKVELSCGQHIRASKDLATTTNYGFSGRFYSPSCVVYFDLKKKELKGLLKSIRLDSQTFRLGGKRFFLSAQLQDQYDLGLFVYKEKGWKPCTLDFEFAVMENSSKEFKSQIKFSKETIGTNGWGTTNLLGIAWTELMSDDCDYFIDNVLHIRVELTLISS